MATKHDTVKELLNRHGQTYAEELGIDLGSPTPSALFELLCASVLYSARIGSQIATEAAQNLQSRGWRTAHAMADSSWEERVTALNEAGYARYQERTATMLGDLAEFINDRYGGDLRRLRDEAERDPRRERALLKEVKGLGDVGVDIFFREVQAAWAELRPFADRRSLQAAKRLKLGDDAEALAELTSGPQQLTRLVAALVRSALEHDQDEVLAAARS
ncbi:MAG TPA: hypothetical protein VE127_02545 [Solirubrobacteraceae bacterium]|nr:hypothetical protein [Solirubrobacteraceae bacterium]